MDLKRLVLWGAIAPVALGGALLVACGDDDDGGGGGGGGDDEAYVRDICNATNEFEDALFAAFTDVDPDASEEDQIAALADPFEDFANAIEDANPPSDLRDWHNNVVDSINDMVKSIRDGDLEVLEQEDDPLGDPPAGVAERLEAVAANVEECSESGLFDSDEG